MPRLDVGMIEAVPARRLGVACAGGAQGMLIHPLKRAATRHGSRRKAVIYG
ncbi:MAG: hypothetical protein Q8M07_11235 [Prosthecobacter sp.]|nr:hypothetical protein [Prosthecobacter sp.]